MLIGRFLQAPLGRVRCVLVRSLSPGPTVSAVCCPSSAGNLTAALRTLSNVSSLPARGTSPRLSGARVLLGPVTVLRSGARAMSGSSPGSDSWGWYGSLAESGPVRLCEQYLVGVQQLTGFPWWLSIIVSTVTVRTLITLPLAAYQVVIIAKVGVQGHGSTRLMSRSEVRCVLSTAIGHYHGNSHLLLGGGTAG